MKGIAGNEHMKLGTLQEAITNMPQSCMSAIGENTHNMDSSWLEVKSVIQQMLFFIMQIAKCTDGQMRHSTRIWRV